MIDRMRSMLRRGKVKNEKFDLNAAIEEVLGLIEGERKKREVQIEFASTPELQAWRDHAEHRLAQQEGRDRFFADYTLQVCDVTRESRFPS